MGLDAERTQVRVIAEERVRELIRTRGIDPMRDHDAIRDAIEQTVADAVGEALASGEALRIDPVQLALEVQHAVAGFGPLQRFFDDPTVEEIWINEPGRVFVARAGRSELTTVVLTDREVRDLVERMLRISGRRLDTSSPFVDAMLPDGSRLHVVIPDITRRHWSVNVRRFVMRPRHVDDLVPAGTVSAQAAAFLSAAVVSGLNIVVAGGTQAGKTTLLSALLGCVPMHERIVSCEEVFELQVAHPRCTYLRYRRLSDIRIARLCTTGQRGTRQSPREPSIQRKSALHPKPSAHVRLCGAEERCACATTGC